MRKLSNRDLRDGLRRLRAAGCPIESTVDTGLIILQNDECAMLDVSGGTGIKVNIRIFWEGPGKITIARLGEVITPWAVLQPFWLEPTQERESRFKNYRFLDGTDFPGDSVLNHRVEAGLKLSPSTGVKGLLLGHVASPIPGIHLHGACLKSEVTMYDFLGSEHRAEVIFIIDRALRTRPRRREALFAPAEGPNPAAKQLPCARGSRSMFKCRADRLLPIREMRRGDFLSPLESSHTIAHNMHRQCVGLKVRVLVTYVGGATDAQHAQENRREDRFHAQEE